MLTACLSSEQDEQEEERRELMDRQGQGQEECCLNVCMVMERRRRGVQTIFKLEQLKNVCAHE